MGMEAGLETVRALVENDSEMMDEYNDYMLSMAVQANIEIGMMDPVEPEGMDNPMIAMFAENNDNPSYNMNGEAITPLTLEFEITYTQMALIMDPNRMEGNLDQGDSAEDHIDTMAANMTEHIHNVEEMYG